MNRMFKRFTSLALALILCLGLAVCASAAEETDLDADLDQEDLSAYDPDEVIIDGVQAGDVISAYRLIKYEDHFNNYVFDADFQRFLQSKITSNENSLAAWMENLSATAITKLLEEYATLCNASDDYTLPSAQSEIVRETAEGTSVNLQLHPGYYLILIRPTESSSKIYQPISVFVKVEADQPIIYGGGRAEALPSVEPRITVKSENGPTIDKQVNNSENDTVWAVTADAGVGDLVHFFVKLEIPHYADISNLNMELTDTLTYLEYDMGSAKVYTAQPNDQGKFEESALLPGAITQVDADEYMEGHQQLKLTLDYQTIIGDSETGREVWIAYDAVVTPDAVGNDGLHAAQNSVYLTYANAATPDNRHVTEPKATTVYNYSVQLQKKGENVAVDLAGAEFTFYRDEACTEPLKFVAEKEDDVDYYRLALPDEVGTFVTAVPANFLLRGLNIGTYYVKETKTPTGYFAPKGAFQLELTSEMRSTTSHEHSGNLNGTTSSFKALETEDAELIATANVTRDIAYRFLIMLKNTTTPNLPTTGGPGTVLFTVGGVAIMTLAVFLFLRRRKRAE